MRSDNRFLDDLAKVANGALAAAAGARQEVEHIVQRRFERFLNERGWVTREEFEAVRDMAATAREEQEALAARVEELEKKAAARRSPARRAAGAARGRGTGAETRKPPAEPGG